MAHFTIGECMGLLVMGWSGGLMVGIVCRGVVRIMQGWGG